MPPVNQAVTSVLAPIDQLQLERRIRREIKAIFKQGLPSLRRVYFPVANVEIHAADGPQLVILPPERAPRPGRGAVREDEPRTLEPDRPDRIIVRCNPASSKRLYGAGRKLLACERVRAGLGKLTSAAEARSADVRLRDARHDLQEVIWQSYNTVVLADRSGRVRVVDLGEIHSSSAATLPGLIACRLLENLPRSRQQFFQALLH